MRKKFISYTLLLISLNTFATENYLKRFSMTYSNSYSIQYECLICHISKTDFSRNSYGQDFEYNNHDFIAIESFDSDVDGYTNIDEINSGLNPGVNSGVPIKSKLIIIPPVKNRQSNNLRKHNHNFILDRNKNHIHEDFELEN